jgi:hypothetical protein
MMFGRAVLVWFGLLVAAFANGTVRELALRPRVDEPTAHAISVGLLSAVILIVSWSTVTWIRPRSSSDAWRVGVLWLALTIAFEFLAGHYLFGAPWSRLWADYNVLRGRIWVMVLITTLAAPAIAARVRGSFSGKPVPDLPKVSSRIASS